jgi:hypothetical protein
MATRNTDHTIRVEIIKGHLAGETLAHLAQKLQLNFYTVRKWWRIYQRQSWSGLVPKPAGPTRGGPLSKFDGLVKYVILRLKREHCQERGYMSPNHRFEMPPNHRLKCPLAR